MGRKLISPAPSRLPTPRGIFLFCESALRLKGLMDHVAEQNGPRHLVASGESIDPISNRTLNVGS